MCNFIAFAIYLIKELKDEKLSARLNVNYLSYSGQGGEVYNGWIWGLVYWHKSPLLPLTFLLNSISLQCYLMILKIFFGSVENFD